LIVGHFSYSLLLSYFYFLEIDLILYFATEYPEFMTSDFPDTMTTVNADGKASESDLGMADVSFFPDVLKAQNVTQQ
jgi:hypothetical protein